ncbi:uracil-DNA glycosylase [Mycobacterium kubicae]|uniref:Type-4 uracil-DNA glycosylase n=1 Tax=Mycobacterium kubicae TaxID=120959 RepID=A0AAX1J5S6_9MYCO|nr:UdgX family uracil-DNA binding protein [Mycobacterium kubicae]MCV7098133.1 UdgX family uracil-DNA binding protein [Mycobacterium kubicae]ORW03513.1 uracil-DNA glycosylase [Mycobacterium kubicae]QNI07314.1 UdgX family uracil-DNA binding protein [Mycobacterium kubicae]QNI12332.1 UdgX family uracil-DNA binding protein [Mycobacterium kubicae]QPI35850.1 UdgX family uracil-DNA binding protein [Mycobacterium kubicae]
MATAPVDGATRYLPDDHSLSSLENAASGCQGCHLYQDATQTVFGHGKGDAPIMLVGEQPGDHEDQQGLPFVGPAGRLLAQALEDAQIDPALTYQTNAVKHFKFKRVGKRRIHQKPGRIEVVACQPWLIAEIEAVQPQVIVCLGATAAQSLLGNAFRVTAHRGERLELPDALHVDVPSQPVVTATVHPSSLLRDRSDDREKNYQLFVDDLRSAGAALK